MVFSVYIQLSERRASSCTSFRSPMEPVRHHTIFGIERFNPFMPTVAFSQLSSNTCCPRDAVSRTAHVGTVGKNGLRGELDLWLYCTERRPCLEQAMQVLPVRQSYTLTHVMRADLWYFFIDITSKFINPLAEILFPLLNGYFWVKSYGILFYLSF